MKTKLKLLALLGALSINAGAAEQAANGFQGELGFGYTSDYYFRGERITGESTQIKAKASTDVSIADAFVCAFANQGLQSVDSYIFAVGLADSYLDGSVGDTRGLSHDRIHAQPSRAPARCLSREGPRGFPAPGLGAAEVRLLGMSLNSRQR